MYKKIFLIFCMILVQTASASAGLHLCDEGRGNHICAGLCPTEKSGPRSSNQERDGAGGDQYCHCGHLPVAVIAEDPLLFRPTTDSTHSEAVLNLNLFGLSDIFHPPA